MYTKLRNDKKISQSILKYEPVRVHISKSKRGSYFMSILNTKAKNYLKLDIRVIKTKV